MANAVLPKLTKKPPGFMRPQTESKFKLTSALASNSAIEACDVLCSAVSAKLGDQSEEWRAVANTNPVIFVNGSRLVTVDVEAGRIGVARPSSQDFFNHLILTSLKDDFRSTVDQHLRIVQQKIGYTKGGLAVFIKSKWKVNKLEEVEINEQLWVEIDKIVLELAHVPPNETSAL